MLEQEFTALLAVVNAHPVLSYYIAMGAIAWPMVRIFMRAGFSPRPVLWLALPFLGYLVTLGYLVFRPWPVLPPRVKKARA